MVTIKSAVQSSQGVELQSHVLLEEYKVVREMVSKHSEWQNQLDALALAGMGAAIPLVLTVVDKFSSAVGVLLLLPIIFFAVAFIQLRHDRLLSLSAIYVDAEIRPKLEKLAQQLSNGKVTLLGYERYLSRRSWSRPLFIEWFAICTHAALSLMIGLGMVLVYFYMRINIMPGEALQGFEIFLLVFDGLFFFGDLFIAFLIARMRHQHQKK